MKTVLCHGVFDVLHAGHLAYFKEAKKYGERLVVSLTGDKFINKGPGRPYFTAIQRAGMVQAIRYVDEVYVVDGPTALPAIEQFRPDFYVKGQDYKDLTKDITGEIANEKAAVEKYGGQLVFTDAEMFSSSAIINRFSNIWTDHQRATIDEIKCHGGYDAIESAIEQVGKLRVLVIGEPILDIYRFCTPEGISSKSPSISARFQYQEQYQGGSLAITNHLRGFCETTPCYTGENVPKKIRYISSDKQQRIFEVTEIKEDQWDRELISDHIWTSSQKNDVVIAADFGHGLFEGPVLKAMDDIKAFVGLNVQTNSSNFGFNLYKKHERYDYLCLDTREARLAEHDRKGSPLQIATRIKKKTAARVGLTVGSNGAYLLDSKDMNHFSPAFTDQVIDATGAGDAYFAITTVLLASGCDPALIPFIGNVFAGLKTKIVGNKGPVSKVSLLKAVKAILA